MHFISRVWRSEWWKHR